LLVLIMRMEHKSQTDMTVLSPTTVWSSLSWRLAVQLLLVSHFP